jgi:hypothetical protein
MDFLKKVVSLDNAVKPENLIFFWLHKKLNTFMPNNIKGKNMFPYNIVNGVRKNPKKTQIFLHGL